MSRRFTPPVSGAFSGPGRSAAKPKPKRKPRPRGITERKWNEIQSRLPAGFANKPQVINFLGHRGSESAGPVSVLAGEAAPVVKGGWPKIAKVPRFQRVALTIPEGWEPVELELSVMFDNIRESKEQRDLEKDIADLEWMAGRQPNPPNGEPRGEPPFVEVYSVDNQGNLAYLIPAHYSSAVEYNGRTKQWWLTDIVFDSGALRDTIGRRERQKATITLTEIVLSPSALERIRGQRPTTGYHTYVTTKTVNTIKKVARFDAHTADIAAILKANPKLGRNPEKHLNPGTRVRVPLSAIHKVPG